MGLVYRLETEIEIEAPADQFYNAFKSKSMHFADIAVGHIHGVDMHEGDWETDGAIKIWTFTVDGRVEVYKEKVQYNDEKREVRQVGVDGDVLKNHYKSCIAIYQATPKAAGCGSTVKVSVIYEKLDGESPHPEKYIDVMIGVSKCISAHLLKA